MGDGTIRRVLATRIMRGGAAFGIQQDLDTGCRDKMSPKDAAPRFALCETRSYKASIEGLWVNQVVRRFVNGESQLLRRAIDDPKPEDVGMWQTAQDKVKWARNVSDWTLDYLDQAHKLNLLSSQKINTGVGPAEVVPQCANRTLLSVTILYRGANLLVEYAAHSEIAPFESQLCAPPVLLAKNE